MVATAEGLQRQVRPRDEDWAAYKDEDDSVTNLYLCCFSLRYNPIEAFRLGAK